MRATASGYGPQIARCTACARWDLRCAHRQSDSGRGLTRLRRCSLARFALTRESSGLGKVHMPNAIYTTDASALILIDLLNDFLSVERGSFQGTPPRMKNGRKSSRSFKDGSDFLRTIAPYQQVTSIDANLFGSCAVEVSLSI